MKHDNQVTQESTNSSHRPQLNHLEIDDLMMGQSLEENLFKVQYVLAVIQQGFTPPGSDIPIKESAVAGLDFLLEYSQRLIEVEIDRLSVSV
ncbi:hypothetical protein [Pleionea sp. CnH1-48]|uniref:hypothetical protein n=1 Tax=Pleionea sp. CnH1-48 TaxID=2954494 RepID=UPI002096DBF5|nr:hypothetical protein [Pleionea sp. CnH1-48]MCO7227591.1 hypothetical protein [Pleionea sp. CnH1-48]